MATFNFDTQSIEQLQLGDTAIVQLDDGSWSVQLFTSRFRGEFVNCGAWFIAKDGFATHDDAAAWSEHNGANGLA